MASNPMSIREVLRIGSQDNFVKTWQQSAIVTKEKLSPMMQVDIPTNERQPRFSYILDAPHPSIWPRGEDRHTEGMLDRSFTIENYNWTVGVEWNEDDERHDQTSSVRIMAQDAGRNTGNLHNRLFSQVMRNNTDAKLLPVIPSAADGQNMYSATNDGSASRYQLSGGNIETGTGVSGAGILADFFNAIERFPRFLNSKGFRFIPDEWLNNYVIKFNPANMQAFNEQFLMKLVAGGSGKSNVIAESGIAFDLQPDNLITDNDWFIFLKNIPAEKAPTFATLDQNVRETFMDRTNSDRMRDKKMVGLMWDLSIGVGVNEPYTTVMVNN